MENKKLNLNRPLLSVRKYPTVTATTSKKDDERKFDNSLLVIPRLPYYSPELKSGPVRNPGAVPFQWEQIPGQPKEDIKPIIQNYGSNQAYVDAIDHDHSLSRTQSFFLNCSLSSLDDLDAKPFGCPSGDPHTRGFMIDRFLPEAKAMASETPQNVPDKIGVEKQREMQKVVHRDRPLLRYGPSFAKKFIYRDKEEEEDDRESDDDCDQHGNFHAVCGFLPRFSLRGSLCLLNPVHVMNVSTREAMHPANNLQPSLASRFKAETDNESKRDISNLKTVDKIQIETLVNEIDRSDLKGIGHSSDVKGFKTFQELLLADDKIREEFYYSGEEVSAVEKTLNVDTMQKVKSPNMRSCSSKDDDGSNFRSIDSSVEDSTEKCNLTRGSEMLKPFEEKQDFNRYSTTIENTERGEKGDRENLEKQLSRKKTRESSNRKYSEFPVPPPLPKSPSDSWLGRTLPNMSTNNVSPRSHPKKPGFKASIKSRKAQRLNLRYAEELLSPIPES